MRREKKSQRDSGTPDYVFKVGGIALAFLIIGYQSALFVHRAAALRVAALRDAPDTVYVVDAAVAAGLLAEIPEMPEMPEVPDGTDGAEAGTATLAVRRNAPHSKGVEQLRRSTRKTESFRFNPNTVSVEDLMRLGFSEKQALSIESYRAKGGKFRRASDFARSYVVADSVFRRLEPFIHIPKLDINKADSADFDDLPGIGPYFAARMVQYRERLGGYSYKEQLMDIRNFDRDKFDALSDLVVCSVPRTPFRLWTLPQDSLRLHPYIKSWQAARSIVLFRENTPPDGWTVQALEDAGILPHEDALRLSKCRIEAPRQACSGEQILQINEKNSTFPE